MGKHDTVIAVRKLENPEHTLKISDLTLNNPSGRGQLVRSFNLALKQGERFVLTGPSGSGKSTVIRAMRGLWHDGDGSVELDQDTDILCLSQETHVPRGDLRRVLTQPLEPGTISDDEIASVLKELDLRKLIFQLPKIQADPRVLGKTAGRYIPLVERECGKKLARLSEEERQEVYGMVKTYIQDHAENFYPVEVAKFIKDDVKTQLADTLCEHLDNLNIQGVKKPSLFSFSNCKENLARDISRILLQGSALELKYRTKNGSQLGHELSGGEMQKLNIARALLLKPKFLIMDEPTSKMDPASTEKVYELLTERLPETTFFGVVHDLDVIKYYHFHGHLKDQVIDVKPVNSNDPAPDLDLDGPA